MTTEQEQLIRRRYPHEGGSQALCLATGLQAWQIRHHANKLGLRVTAEHLRRFKTRWNRQREFVKAK